jgi:hypothetical protein
MQPLQLVELLAQGDTEAIFFSCKKVQEVRKVPAQCEREKEEQERKHGLPFHRLAHGIPHALARPLFDPLRCPSSRLLRLIKFYSTTSFLNSFSLLLVKEASLIAMVFPFTFQ